MSVTIGLNPTNGTHETAHEPRVRVGIERGQRGTYGWEITVRGETADDVLREIERVDQELRRTYGPDSFVNS